MCEQCDKANGTNFFTPVENLEALLNKEWTYEKWDELEKVEDEEVPDTVQQSEEQVPELQPQVANDE